MIQRRILLSSLALALVLATTGCVLDRSQRLELRRDFAFSLFEEGYRFKRAGNFYRAREKFVAAAEASPRPAFLYEAGHCHYRLGQLEEAEVYYRSALEESPDFALAQAELDLVRLQLREREIKGAMSARESSPLEPAATADPQEVAAAAVEEAAASYRLAPPPEERPEPLADDGMESTAIGEAQPADSEPVRPATAPPPLTNTDAHPCRDTGAGHGGCDDRPGNAGAVPRSTSLAGPCHRR